MIRGPMSEASMDKIRSCFEHTNRLYQENRLYETYKLGSIWNEAIWPITRFIRSAENVDQFLKSLNATWMTNIAIHGEKAKRSITWLQAYLESVGYPIDSFGADVAESSHYPESACVALGQRRVSSDFLWRLTIIERLERNILFPKEHFYLCELGSGSANFMRIIKLIHPLMTGVLIDLPETLAIAHANLISSFPEAKILYITDAKKEHDFAEFDFILVPTAFRDVVENLVYFAFFNCNSLGEMPNFVMKYWIEFVENRLDVEYGFFLNRFLNRIDPGTMMYRAEENRASLLYDRNWEILDWEVDPPFERNPYATNVARNLLFIARRSGGPDKATAQKVAHALICEINHEDWYTDDYPKFLVRGDRDLTPDLTRTGTLFKLWEAFRLAKDDETISALLKYLTVLGGTGTPFEETFALKHAQ